MNLQALLLLGIGVVIAVVLIWICVSSDLYDPTSPAIILALFAIAAILVSFLAPLGTTTELVVPAGSFEIEKTPFRVIFSVDGEEREFTDALTVVKTTRQDPTCLHVTRYRNAWGMLLKTDIKPSWEPLKPELKP
jgi:hypothetical protein